MTYGSCQLRRPHRAYSDTISSFPQQSLKIPLNAHKPDNTPSQKPFQTRNEAIHQRDEPYHAPITTMRQRDTPGNGQVRRGVENQRPVQRKAPDIPRVIEIIRLLVMSWQRVVERGERRRLIVDRDAVAGHWGCAAALGLQQKSRSDHGLKERSLFGRSYRQTRSGSNGCIVSRLCCCRRDAVCTVCPLRPRLVWGSPRSIRIFLPLAM